MVAQLILAGILNHQLPEIYCEPDLGERIKKSSAAAGQNVIRLAPAAFNPLAAP
jgi:hypothetical protein